MSWESVILSLILWPKYMVRPAPDWVNLITHWPGIVNANYAARTQPVKISEQHQKGAKKFDQNTIKATLHMRVEGPILLDLTHSKSQILQD